MFSEKIRQYYTQSTLNRGKGNKDLRIYNSKAGNPSWSLSFSINFGVLEYWSNDGRMDVFFSTLQYSITPLCQGRDFQELSETFELPFYWLQFQRFINRVRTIHLSPLEKGCSNRCRIFRILYAKSRSMFLLECFMIPI